MSTTELSKISGSTEQSGGANSGGGGLFENYKNIIHIALELVLFGAGFYYLYSKINKANEATKLLHDRVLSLEQVVKEQNEIIGRKFQELTERVNKSVELKNIMKTKTVGERPHAVQPPVEKPHSERPHVERQQAERPHVERQVETKKNVSFSSTKENIIFDSNEPTIFNKKPTREERVVIIDIDVNRPYPVQADKNKIVIEDESELDDELSSELNELMAG